MFPIPEVKMRRAVKSYIFLASLVLALVAPEANADKFQCRAVNKISRLGAPSGTTVSITADEDERECRFSIAGESAGSPPQEQLNNALVGFRSGVVARELERGESDSLAFLLLAAAAETSIPADLKELLRENSKDLTRCFERAKSGDSAFEGVNNNRVRCGKVAAGKPFEAGPLTLEAQRARFYVVVRRGGKTHAVFFEQK
jgi:hypothetical protein